MTSSVLVRLQRGIETLYRVDTRLEVDAFVIGAAERDGAGVSRAPREQLLVEQRDDELRLGLFLDRRALANLERNDPGRGLTDANFWDFCLAVEGVSHFIYLCFCAAAERAVSALELELQAEVDKFACCLLLQMAHVAQVAPGAIRRRLYEEVRLARHLDPGERTRYRVANAEARRYALGLDRRFIATRRVEGLLAELRSFYRLDRDAKLRRIAQLAG